MPVCGGPNALKRRIVYQGFAWHLCLLICTALFVSALNVGSATARKKSRSDCYGGPVTASPVSL